ncbi:MAG: thioredoxin domain-containing protein [Actinomycetota bacterium]|nr:thioredoxin domain-containing protein [Actinomycetota bacterium]
MTNRLADEASPYLLQHKDNPVDWYPWGEEAFTRAKKEGKPVLLSIGYAACHWCHVMEHESFEDDETATVMNEHFVSIKVDREERPDIDSIYMDAVQAMTGHGGWPMTVFLTPEGTPFYGGTYFPPVERHGMPSFRALLAGVAEAWRDRRTEVQAQGQRLVEHVGVAAKLKPSSDVIAEDLLFRAVQQLSKSFDSYYGGFGGAPKFPQPMTIDFLLRMSARGDGQAGDMARKTLDGMAAGGMFDQLRGGFARYSVDKEWIIPHFEKMLYDNAQLLRTYARSYVATGAERHREVAEETAAWMLDEMRDSRGGFWSSLDADSEGEEGKFYVWSLDEVAEVTGEDAGAAIDRWGFTETGNFEGHNIPVLASDDVDPEAVERARRALLERRSTRVRPGTDDKVLTGWSCLAAAGLAEAGTALRRPEWVQAAAQAVSFTLETMRPDGRLLRSFRSDESGETIRHLGVCEDYAFLLEACLTLYESTHDLKWLTEARWAADEAIRLFAGEETGGFFTTGSDGESLVVRPKDLMDNAIPSANSVLALQLQRLALFTGHVEYEKYALSALRLVLDAARRSPQGFGHVLEAVDFYTGAPAEVVVIGDPEANDTQDFLRVVRENFIPNKIVIVSGGPTAEEVEAVPLLAQRGRIEGRVTAYVCRNGTCKLPVTKPDEVLEQIRAG